MRGEERTLAGEGGTRQGGKESVQNFSHTTEFGWVFPRSKARRHGVIDAAWLRDFSRDIETLQEEIKRQTACVYENDTTSYQEEGLSGDCRSEIGSLKSENGRQKALVQRDTGTDHHADILREDRHIAKCSAAMKCNASECCTTDTVKCKDRRGVPEMITGLRVSTVSSSVQTCGLNSSVAAACSKMASDRESKSKVRGCVQGLEGELGRVSPQDDEGESSWREKSFVVDSRLHTYAAGATECVEDSSMHAKEKVQEPPHAGESSGCENSFVLASGLNTEGAVAKCDEYSSMQSDVSRDSGVFSTYDTSFLSEASADGSLLQELGDVLSNQYVSLETRSHCGSLSLEEAEQVNKGQDGCTVWLTRFSSSNDLSSRWGSYEWEGTEAEAHDHERCCSFDSITPVVPHRKQSVSEEYDDHVTPPDVAVHEQEEVMQVKQCSACVKLCGRVKVKLCSACEKLNESLELKASVISDELKGEVRIKQHSACENGMVRVKVKQCVTCEKQRQESPVTPSPMQEISEMARLSKSFKGISKRVEDLRSSLDCLAEEVTESKLEFMDLEERAKHLLASTVLSRHRLKRVRVLQLLEDRLQEEWWAAYDPGSVPFHENYIV